jgi:carbonic anhydrase
MLLRLTALALIGLSFSALADAPHWDYKGHAGPAHWSTLDAGFKECGVGHVQSPIDIRNASPDKAAPDLQFGYSAQPLRILNNGHTIQVNETAGTLNVGEHRYQLVQFHFHSPSEERINGRSYDMVAHLVHKDDTGKLAVVAVLFKLGHENAALKPVLNNLPIAAGPEHVIDSIKLNVADLLPAQHGYYHFMGSLTTPPCSENVSWYVLKQAVELSAAQLKTFHRLYNHNNRPIQPRGGRSIVEHS